MASGRQFVKYDLFAIDPLWRRLPDDEKDEGRREFSAVIDELSSDMFIRSFSMVGLRGDVDFMLWHATENLEQLQEMATRLWSTKLGKYLTQSYSYLALTRKSQYVGKHKHTGQEGTSESLMPGNAKYFVLYPMTKTRQWYALPQEERQRMMSSHFTVGHKYPSVKINTSYSFGLDDQEFMVGFETDEPSDFLDLVMELRSSEVSSYTLIDTPIFTGIHRSIEETLASLGD
jgi:chlorite dismutase